MIQNKKFTSGINSDAADIVLPEGVDRYRLNVRTLSTNSGNDLTAETILGNTLVTTPLPDGKNICIGNYEDKRNGKNYAFIYNNLGVHTIYEYDQATNNIALVMIDNCLSVPNKILRFQPNYLITGINVLGGVLYWSDDYISPDDENDYNEPKQVDIAKGKAYCNNDYVNGYANTEWTEFRLYLTQIKQPPLDAPSYEWNTIAEVPLRQVYVTSEDGLDLVVDALDGVVQYLFPIVVDNHNNIYDVGTSKATIVVNGEYYSYVKLWIYTILGLPVNATIYIYKNGVALSSQVYSITNDPTEYSFDLLAFDLIVGDVIDIRVSTDVNINIVQQEGIDSWEIKLLLPDASKKLNNLFKKTPNFQVQFVHINNQRSTLSPISGYSFQETSQIGGTEEDFIYQSNEITVHIPTGIATVEKIRLYVRMLQSADGSEPSDNAAVFVVELDKKKLNIPDNSTYDYAFFNDHAAIPADANETELLYSYLPIAAKAEEIGDGREFLGNITEGMQPIDTDWRFDVDYELVDSPSNVFWVNRTYLKSGGIYSFGEINYDETGLRSGVTWAVNAKTTELQNDGRFGTNLFLPFLTNDDYAPAQHSAPFRGLNYCPKVTIKIYNRPNGNAKKYQIARTKNQETDFYFQFNAQQIIYQNNDGTPSAYADSTRVYISIANIAGRYKTENPNSLLAYDNMPGDRLRIIAYPTDFVGGSNAYNDRFVFNESSIIEYGVDANGQFIVVPLSPNFPDMGTNNHVTPALYELYRPKPLVTPDAQLTYETGEEGDIFVDAGGSLSHSGNSDQSQLFFERVTISALLPTITVTVDDPFDLAATQDVKIITDTGNIFGVVVSVVGSVVTVDTTGEEVRPIGGVIGVKGTMVRSAHHLLSSGDCFRRYTNIPFIDPDDAGHVYRMHSYIECMNASNMFFSEAWDYGRPNRIDYVDKRKTLEGTIRFSQLYIENTFINNLNIFLPLDFEDYYSTLGSIQKLFFRNQQLDCYQQIKVQSIPISQSVLSANQGQIIIGKSDVVLSPQTIVKAYEAEFGIGNNPESHAWYANARYFVDVKRSAILRLSLDGIINLTASYGMSVFWADVCSQILSHNGKVKIYGVFDARFGEYIVSVEPFGEFAGCTLAFNEGANQFTGFYSYLPENMGTAGQDIITFDSGILYTHNNNANIATFYGTYKSPEIWSVINSFPNNEKIFQVLEENSDDAWVCIEATTPAGQATRMIYPSNWTKKEKIWYSEFKRDINTPNITNPIISGDQMRGVTCLVKLRYLGTTISVFRDFNAYFLNSPKHNQE